jgi:hypothetical protein
MRVHNRHMWVDLLIAGLPLLGCATTLGASSANASPGSSLWTSADLHRLISKWQARDGSAVFVLSDQLCDFAVGDPALFTRVMNETPTAWNSWIDGLSDSSFVDRGGCIDRECLRTTMIKSLELAKLDGPSERLREALLNRLRGILVRHVD